MDELLLQALRKDGLGEEDVVKLVFQGLLGCGHLLADEQTVTQRILHERQSLTPDPLEPLYEAVSRDYIRLNLRPAMALGLPDSWIARLMLCSDAPAAGRDDVAAALTGLQDRGIIRIDLPRWLEQVADPHWLPSHSEAYRAAMRPAYRVIGRRFAPLLPVLGAMADAARRQPRALVTVDGPCGSGKTTLAAQLSAITGAPVVHTDDFVVPHARKTPERLAQPGGNEDHERLLREFVLPWLNTGHAEPRPYSCHEDRLLAPVTVPDAPLAILEGSYGNMPDIRARAAVRVYVRLDREECLRRIARRDGAEAVPMFISRWIPLEEAYRKAFGLPDAECVTVDGASLLSPAANGGD